MRVLVTGTGRCGSVTFYHACRHIENYAVAHETAFLVPWFDKLRLDPGAIEVNPSARAWAALAAQRHEDLVLVELRRARAPCIESLVRQRNRAGDYILALWGWLYVGRPNGAPSRLYAAEILYDATAAMLGMIGQVLGPDRYMRFEIEHAARDWPAFCNLIGAEGDLAGGLAEFENRHNTGQSRGER